MKFPFPRIRTGASALALCTLASSAFAQSTVDPPDHFPELLLGIESAFSTAELFLVDAETLPEFQIAFATALAEAAIAFDQAGQGAVDELYADPPPDGVLELVAYYDQAATGSLLTALAVNQGDIPAAGVHWEATRDAVAESFEWVAGIYSSPDVDEALVEFCASMDRLQDSLDLLEDPASLTFAFDDMVSALDENPVSFALEIASFLSNATPEILVELDLDGPEDIADLVTLWQLLQGVTGLDVALLEAQSDPVSWVAHAMAIGMAVDFDDLRCASTALLAVLPDEVSTDGFLSAPCVDLCASAADCPVTLQFALGTTYWEPHEFNKAVDKARAALDLGSKLPKIGAVVAATLGAGSQEMKALKGLNKAITARNPIPYFRLCRPRCKSTWCPGTWWVEWERAKRCKGQKYTEWIRLPDPPSHQDLPGNSFAQMGSWGTADTLQTNTEDYDEAVDALADDLISAAGGDDAFFDEN